MAKRKQPKEIEFSCYLCKTFPSLKILRREGDNGEIAKECVGKTVRGKDLACSDFLPAKYFWCDHASQRISTKICNDRRTRSFSECPQSCVLGNMAKKIESEKGRIIKRMEISHESILCLGREGQPWRVDLGTNPDGNSCNQERKELSKDIGRIINRVF